jgi:hypothetical protein
MINRQSYTIRFRAFVTTLSNKYEQFDETKTNKRTYEESFGVREYDNERYGQEIPDNFFKRNIGHGTYE